MLLRRVDLLLQNGQQEVFEDVLTEQVVQEFFVFLEIIVHYPYDFFAQIVRNEGLDFLQNQDWKLVEEGSETLEIARQKLQKLQLVILVRVLVEQNQLVLEESILLSRNELDGAEDVQVFVVALPQVLVDQNLLKSVELVVFREELQNLVGQAQNFRLGELIHLSIALIDEVQDFVIGFVINNQILHQGNQSLGVGVQLFDGQKRIEQLVKRLRTHLQGGEVWKIVQSLKQNELWVDVRHLVEVSQGWAEYLDQGYILSQLVHYFPLMGKGKFLEFEKEVL